MRKSDLEMLEVRLEPLQTTRDRHESEIASNKRYIVEIGARLKELERDADAHKTDIAQGLASIRSLLQRANRAAREQGIVEEDEVAPEVPAVNVPRTRDDIIRDARQRHAGRTIL